MKDEKQFHQEYLQGKREDQYRGSSKIIFWLVVFYAAATFLYVSIKVIISLFNYL